ncbi:MAG: L-threonylcarbamoyladenylate synthase [Thermodesulfovibrionales bacterium]
MQILKLKNYGLDYCISQALSALKRGGIIGYPTETFYGIGVRFDSEAALAKLYEIKGRPKEKALPLIIGHAGLLPLVAAEIPRHAELLISRFWPGPLTILFPAREGTSPLITAGTGKVAVRMPGASFALSFAAAAECPITATSANISGLKPASDPLMLAGYFSNVLDVLIDGGPTPGGRPSTIVDAAGAEVRVVRQGVIPDEDIFSALR